MIWKLSKTRRCTQIEHDFHSCSCAPLTGWAFVKFIGFGVGRRAIILFQGSFLKHNSTCIFIFRYYNERSFGFQVVLFYKWQFHPKDLLFWFSCFILFFKMHDSVYKFIPLYFVSLCISSLALVFFFTLNIQKEKKMVSNLI